MIGPEDKPSQAYYDKTPESVCHNASAQQSARQGRLRLSSYRLAVLKLTVVQLTGKT